MSDNWNVAIFSESGSACTSLPHIFTGCYFWGSHTNCLFKTGNIMWYNLEMVCLISISTHLIGSWENSSGQIYLKAHFGVQYYTCSDGYIKQPW